MAKATAQAPEPFDLFADEGTVRIFLDPEQRFWVELKRSLDFGEAGELDNSLVRGWQSNGSTNGSAAPDQMMAVVDVARQRLMRISLYVVDWYVEDRDRKPIRWPRPLHERMALVKRMAPKGAQMILDEIERLTGEEAATAKAEPDAAGNPTSAGALASGSPSS